VSASDFDVTSVSYGAVGNGKVVTDGAMTSGSATLTSATAGFVSGDVGKVIQVKGAGATGITTLVTTITGYTNSTTVTLGASAAAAVTGAYVLWGTDDTSAIQSAINAAYTYAVAHGAARVLIPVAPAGKFYAIGGALQQGGSTLGNSQLTIPIAGVNANKVVLEIAGDVNGSAAFHWDQHTPQLSGSTLVSFGVYSGVSAQINDINANGNAAVIGGPSQGHSYGTSPSLLFSNMLITLKNLSIMTSYSTYGLGYGAFDFSGIAEANVFDVGYGVASTYGDLQSVNNLATGLSIGALMPANGNNDNNSMRNITVWGGYTYGLFATEHTVVAGGLRITYCWAGLVVVGSYFSGVGASHAVWVDQLSCEGCTRHIYMLGSGQSGQGPTINIGQWDSEQQPYFWDGSNGGAGGHGLGQVYFTGYNTFLCPQPTGVRFINLIQQPGYVATPSYSLNTPFMNPFWRDASVTITGGTVTGIKVGKGATGAAALGGTSAPTMQSLGITSGTVRIPAGVWMEIDGSAAPSMAWVLD
jgi:hypothetical protein